MKIIKVESKNYTELLSQTFSVFDSVSFSELNKHKCDEVLYLIFNDGKNRFGLIAGIKDNILEAPFSAPYACFSKFSQDIKTECYIKAVAALVAFSKLNGFKKLRITLPPSAYDENHIAKLHNAFYVSDFHIAGCDLSFHYDLSKFNENYEENLNIKSRQKLRAALKNNLIFEKTADIAEAYRIIKENRDNKGYPLWMSYEEVIKTVKIIKADFFILRNDAGAIASAMVYRVARDKAQVVYWGNVANTDNLKPMNYLAFKLFEFYKAEGIYFFDTGTSTKYSIPNFGLCDFKQSLGCICSAKFSFELDI